MGGYVIKSVRAKLKNPQDNELTLGLDELCITDDDVEPAESEEWLCSIDRGGLTRITDDAYLFFVSIETSVRRHFHIGNTHCAPILCMCSSVVYPIACHGMHVSLRCHSQVQVNWLKLHAPILCNTEHLQFVDVSEVDIKWQRTVASAV